MCRQCILQSLYCTKVAAQMFTFERRLQGSIYAMAGLCLGIDVLLIFVLYFETEVLVGWFRRAAIFSAVVPSFFPLRAPCRNYIFCEACWNKASRQDMPPRQDDYAASLPTECCSKHDSLCIVPEDPSLKFGTDFATACSTDFADLVRRRRRQAPIWFE